MNHMPRLNRRAFVVGTAAAGAGLALGFDIPFGGPNVVRAADGAPEVNAWVVIRPDDTVVIRIARSEMGQGTLTGLAQLVAEELDVTGPRSRRNIRRRARAPRASARGAAFSTGGSTAFVPRSSMSARAAPAARMMLIQAAANEWKVPVTECTAANSVITHAFGPHHDLRQGGGSGSQSRAAHGRQAEGPQGLEDRGQEREASRHRDKTTGKMIYGIDVKLPGMLNAAIKACPCSAAN